MMKGKLPSSISIRLATPQDIQNIIIVQTQSAFVAYVESHILKPEHIATLFFDYQREFFEKRIINTSIHQYLVAVDYAKEYQPIIGFCHSTKTYYSHEISSLYILPTHQKKSIGSQLLNKAINWLGNGMPISVQVLKQNKPAIHFYEQHGFIQIPQITDIYSKRLLAIGVKVPKIQLLRK